MLSSPFNFFAISIWFTAPFQSRNNTPRQVSRTLKLLDRTKGFDPGALLSMVDAY